MYPEKLPNQDMYLYLNKYCFYSPLNLTRGFVEKNFFCYMHEQEFYEINIIVKGSGMHYIKDKKVLAKEGDIFIIPPFVSHGYCGGEGFDVYHVLLSNEFMNKYISELKQLPNFYTLFSAEPLMRSSSSNALHLTLNKKQLEKANQYLITMQNCKDYQNSYECLNSTHTTILFIMYLCEIYNKNLTNIETLTEEECFMKSISYMHEHYNEKITLDFLVKLSRMSRSGYINKFKEICKMPPLAYLNKIRISSAEELLLKTDLSVTEVAFKTGFYDCSHFFKIFLKEKGISPYTFKKQKKII